MAHRAASDRDNEGLSDGAYFKHTEEKGEQGQGFIEVPDQAEEDAEWHRPANSSERRVIWIQKALQLI